MFSITDAFIHYTKTKNFTLEMIEFFQLMCLFCGTDASRQ